MGRNTASAVRTETDANIYFTGTLATYTTNSSGQPILDPTGGQTSGSPIRVLVNALTNAIGTVALQDVKTNIALAYEGSPLTISNVINGSLSALGLRALLLGAVPGQPRRRRRNWRSSPTCCMA